MAKRKLYKVSMAVNEEQWRWPVGKFAYAKALTRKDPEMTENTWLA